MIPTTEEMRKSLIRDEVSVIDFTYHTKDKAKAKKEVKEYWNNARVDEVKQLWAEKNIDEDGFTDKEVKKMERWIDSDKVDLRDIANIRESLINEFCQDSMIYDELNGKWAITTKTVAKALIKFLRRVK